MVGKEDIYRMLREEEIWHEITEHPAVYNMEEMAQIKLPYPEADAKNLFVRDSKRRDYYLITGRGSGGLEAVPAAESDSLPKFCLGGGAGRTVGSDPGGGHPAGPAQRRGQTGFLLPGRILLPAGGTENRRSPQ